MPSYSLFSWKLRNCIQYETQYYICMNIDHLNICFTYLRQGFIDALCLFNYVQVKKQSFITTKGVKCSLTTSEWIVTGKAITKLSEKMDFSSDIRYKGILSRNSASDLIVVFETRKICFKIWNKENLLQKPRASPMPFYWNFDHLEDCLHTHTKEREGTSSIQAYNQMTEGNVTEASWNTMF